MPFSSCTCDALSACPLPWLGSIAVFKATLLVERQGPLAGCLPLIRVLSHAGYLAGRICAAGFFGRQEAVPGWAARRTFCISQEHVEYCQQSEAEGGLPLTAKPTATALWSLHATMTQPRIYRDIYSGSCRSPIVQLLMCVEAVTYMVSQ